MGDLSSVASAANRRYTETGQDVVAEVGSHGGGPAIDLKGPDAPGGGLRDYSLLKDVHEAGYIVTNVKEFDDGLRVGPKVRVFLRDASARFDQPDVEDVAEQAFFLGLFMGVAVEQASNPWAGFFEQ